MQRGLILPLTEGKKRLFRAETPEKLRLILRSQRQELEIKEQGLDTVLPALLALFSMDGAKPKVRYLEGIEGLQTLRHMFEELPGEFVEILAYDDVKKIPVFQKGSAEHQRNLGRRLTPHRALLVMENPDLDSINVIRGGEVRLLHASRFPIHGELSVRADTVFLFSYQPSFLSVVVTSRVIADIVRSLFNMAWDQAATYGFCKRSPEKELSKNML